MQCCQLTIISKVQNSSVAVSTANERKVSIEKNRDVRLIFDPRKIDPKNLFLGYS